VVEPQVSRELDDVAALIGGEEGDAHPSASRAARPPDAVRVGVTVVGHVVVDDVRDPVHVDSPGGDIGRHQGGDVT
jgi:hypothetical protein